MKERDLVFWGWSDGIPDLWELRVQQLGGAQTGCLAELTLIDQGLVSTHGLVG